MWGGNSENKRVFYSPHRSIFTCSKNHASHGLNITKSGIICAMAFSLKQTLKNTLPPSVLAALEPGYRLLEATAAAANQGFPAQGMHVIGVTGTNGKTTTCFMIHRMLVEAGYNVGLMTTVAYGVNDDITSQTEHMTTVSAPLLQQRLAEFRRRNVQWVVLEVTSHALAQHRIFGIPIDIAVMTNVTHEHLDYHKTFERYRAAKMRLFKLARRVGIINADDPSAAVFEQAVPRSLCYGIADGNIRATNITQTASGSRYDVWLMGEMHHIAINMPGEFNIANSLAAVAVGHEVGLSRVQIEHGLAALTGVDGRMTVVDAGQPFSAIVDFAHTPDAFERLLGSVRASTKGKLIVLFGSAGRRDESKRAIQGKIAGRIADELILTEEDDRDVDGQHILAQIAKGAEAAGKTQDTDLFLIHDRAEAIRFAIRRARTARDTVVFLGKGHEKTIERADGTYPWDEITEVRNAIHERQASKKKSARAKTKRKKENNKRRKKSTSRPAKRSSSTKKTS